MRKLVGLAVMLLVLAACGDDSVIELPTAPTTPLVSGGWQGVVTSSTLPNSVWSMTLSQEDVAASGTWTDDVNLLDGTVSISISADGRVIGTMTLNVRAALGGVAVCTASSIVRGTVDSDEAMSWLADGWLCAGSPAQAKMEWRRQ